MKEYFQYTINGFIPVSNTRQYKIGEVYEVELKQVRNPLFHKKFFALLNKGYEHTKMKDTETGQPPTFDTYRFYMIAKSGHREIFNSGKGQMVMPKSIAFGKMDQETFEDLYSRVLDLILQDIEVDEETLLKELGTFL